MNKRLFVLLTIRRIGDIDKSAQFAVHQTKSSFNHTIDGLLANLFSPFMSFCDINHMIYLSCPFYDLVNVI